MSFFRRRIERTGTPGLSAQNRRRTRRVQPRKIPSESACHGHPCPVAQHGALPPEKVFEEYKGRCEIEQLFDRLKNTPDASVSHMQNEEALQGWMFVNHIAMQVLCQLCDKLKKAPLNKTQILTARKSAISPNVTSLPKRC